MDSLEVPSIIVDRRMRPHTGPRERRSAERRSVQVEVLEERRKSDRRSARLGGTHPGISLSDLDTNLGSDALR